MKTFKLRFWILEADLVGLALFIDKATVEGKTKMGEKLAIGSDLDKKRWTTAAPKPFFGNSEPVTKESLRLDASLLQSPVLSWKANEAYNQGKKTAHHLTVTIDDSGTGYQTDH